VAQASVSRVFFYARASKKAKKLKNILKSKDYVYNLEVKKEELKEFHVN